MKYPLRRRCGLFDFLSIDCVLDDHGKTHARYAVTVLADWRMFSD